MAVSPPKALLACVEEMFPRREPQFSQNMFGSYVTGDEAPVGCVDPTLAFFLGGDSMPSLRAFSAPLPAACDASSGTAAAASQASAVRLVPLVATPLKPAMITQWLTVITTGGGARSRKVYRCAAEITWTQAYLQDFQFMTKSMLSTTSELSTTEPGCF